jgi:peptide/nickel transport system substrate-binding protein
MSAGKRVGMLTDVEGLAGRGSLIRLHPAGSSIQFQLDRYLGGGFAVHFKRVICALTVLAVVSNGCAPTPPSPASNSSSHGGRVIVGSITDAKVLNPIVLFDLPSGSVTNQIYESLIALNKDTGLPEPRLAEKFEQSADARTLTFVLREGLQWSDGSPFTGDDFLFTAEAVMRSKKTIWKNRFQDISGALDFAEGKAQTIGGIAVSGTTITVTFAKPSCAALSLMGAFPILPKSVFGRYLDPNDASKNLDDATENVSPTLAMGPFRFKEWVPNDHITLVRNERFFLKPPDLDELVFKVYPTASGVAAALKAGEVDLALVQPGDLDALRSSESLRLIAYPDTTYTFISWNQLRGGKEFFRDQAIRQALAYGLDWDGIIKTVYAGQATRIMGPLHPASWAYDSTGLNPYSYDPAKARQLLESDGWQLDPDGTYAKNGQRLEFTLTASAGDRAREAVQQVAIEQYGQIGIHVEPRTEAFEALSSRITQSKDSQYGDEGGRDFDAVVAGQANSPDPDTMYVVWHSTSIKSGFNNIGYSNLTTDQELEDGRSQCSAEARKQIYSAMNKQLNEQQPFDFGLVANNLLFVNNRVQGVEAGSWYSFPSFVHMRSAERWSVQ